MHLHPSNEIMFPHSHAYRPRSIIVAVERLAFTIDLFFALSNGKRKLFMYERALSHGLMEITPGA